MYTYALFMYVYLKKYESKSMNLYKNINFTQKFIWQSVYLLFILL